MSAFSILSEALLDLEACNELKRHPMRLGELVIVTNFDVMACTPAPEEKTNEDMREVPSYIAPKIESILADIDATMADSTINWTKATDHEWQPDDEYKCDSCFGVGKVKSDVCLACEGGYFWNGNHEYECRDCDGTGEKVTPDQEGDVCRVCDGVGYRLQHAPTSIGTDDLCVPARYLRLLASIDAQVATTPRNLSFVFRSGATTGAVMALLTGARS